MITSFNTVVKIAMWLENQWYADTMAEQFCEPEPDPLVGPGYEHFNDLYYQFTPIQLELDLFPVNDDDIPF
jgi:hypothetical protein